MDQTLVGHTLLLLYILFFNGVMEVQSQEPTPKQGDAVSNFEPSLAVVIGILLIMFSTTFFLLIFAKFCRRPTDLPLTDGGVFTRSRRFSGIDKKLIDSLPFFRFSALKGSREGLECAVCLSKFDDVEMLRLLPKCKHAFHIECIDNWLEHHSTCPLCRHKLGSEDVRISNESNLEMLIQREEDEDDGGRNNSSHGSSRFGTSFRKMFFKGTSVTNHREENPTKETFFHKYKHKIVMSDVVFKNRWSNVSSSDIMFLNTEMLGAQSSDRFSQVEANPSSVEMSKIKDVEGKSSSSKMVGSKRSQSEITVVPRFVRLKVTRNDGDEEERRRQMWFPIARRTVQWFASREKTSRKITNLIDQLE